MQPNEQNMTFQKNLKRDFEYVETILNEKFEISSNEFFNKLQTLTNESDLPKTYFRNIKSLFFAKNIKYIKRLVNNGTDDLNYLLKVKDQEIEDIQPVGSTIFKHNLNKPPKIIKMEIPGTKKSNETIPPRRGVSKKDKIKQYASENNLETYKEARELYIVDEIQKKLSKLESFYSDVKLKDIPEEDYNEICNLRYGMNRHLNLLKRSKKKN